MPNSSLASLALGTAAVTSTSFACWVWARDFQSPSGVSGWYVGEDAHAARKSRAPAAIGPERNTRSAILMAHPLFLNALAHPNEGSLHPARRPGLPKATKRVCHRP